MIEVDPKNLHINAIDEHIKRGFQSYHSGVES